MQEVEDSLLENSLYRIFPENPLHFGLFLDTITTGNLCYSNCYKQSLDEGQSLSFIETSDCISGQVAYKIPEQGEVEAVRFQTSNDCIILQILALKYGRQGRIQGGVMGGNWPPPPSATA